MPTTRTWTLTALALALHAGAWWAIDRALAHRAPASSEATLIVATLTEAAPTPAESLVAAPVPTVHPASTRILRATGASGRRTIPAPAPSSAIPSPPQAAPAPSSPTPPSPTSAVDSTSPHARAHAAAPGEEATTPSSQKGAATTAPSPAANPSLATASTAASPAVRHADAPLPIPLGDLRCHTVEPRYPLASRRLGEQGLVKVRLQIDDTGATERVQLLSSSGFERLDAVALEAARATRCQPYRRDGQAIRVAAVQPFAFRLE